MRIHQLTLSAFGPFAGTQVVDFEELNDGGVFLIAGPTGAGKTSILDAVCFALFGQVPGERGVKALRSDHAEPEARPEVVLDVTLAGRRFVVRRTPEWQRPKRRGTGTTTEKAAASLLEVVDGETRLLSSRAQEVGHFLSDLLGMTASQFQQVAMLPQGEFQTFLRATSQERHDVLQQLFRTERFTRIEEWVHDHSRRLRDLAARGETDVRRLVDNLADRAAAETPAGLLGDSLAHAASAGEVLPWAHAVLDVARAALAEAAAAHEAATAGRQLRQHEHHEAVRLHELHAGRDRARAVLTRLTVAGAVEAAARARSRLEAADRAAGCLPLLRLLEESERARDRARSKLVISALPEVTDPRDQLAAGTTRLARLEALLPRERDLHQARAAISAGDAELAALHERLGHAEAQLAELPDHRADLTQRVDELLQSARGLDSTEQELARARDRAVAAAALPEAESQLESLRVQAADARDAAVDARERLLDVVARRLAGMAAELAGALTEGVPCQVCGSAEHPAPASPSRGSVDQAAQLAAQAEADALRTVQEAAQARVQEAELAAATLRHRAAGLTTRQAAAAVSTAEKTLAAASLATAQLAAARAELSTLDQGERELQASVRTLRDGVARVEAALSAQAAAVTRLETQLVAELADSPDLAAAIGHEQRQLRLLAALAEASEAFARAEGDVARLEEALHLSAAEQGFDDLDSVRGALLSDDERARLDREVRAREEALAEATRALAHPDLADLPEHRPDLEALQRSLDEAAAQETQAARAHHVAHERSSALDSQLLRLERALIGWAPAREEFLTAEAMSRLVRGLGTDNQLQLRLSSYVLATRLDQVLAAANERLAHMREQRYHLERTGDAARKGSQAGLGLRVVDDWTGEARDPATLSGGETFVVSLALALGLSDVVSAESGGVQLGTLFIDEGFGMLDLDTLDDVMDRLDSLRAGGRTVGVVSHVTELRSRIPTQLYVDKGRSGSSVRVTTLVG